MPLRPARPFAWLLRVLALPEAPIGTGRGPLLLALAGLGTGALALAVRLVHLDTAYDLFIDEVTYQRVSQHLQHTGRLVLYGEPFHLHPPATFVLEAAVLALTGRTGEGVGTVLAMRRLDVALACLTAVLLVLLVRRVASLPAAIAAGVLYAIDGFTIKATSRNMLEALTVLLVVAAVLVLTGPGGRRVAVSRRRDVAAGVLCGLAMMSNEVAAFLTLLPLALAWVTGWSLPRPTALRVALVGTATYLVYPAYVLLVGDGPAFADQKLRGLLRLVGVVQETGFNTPAGPSLSTAITANLLQFGTTYAVLAFGGPATLLLLLGGSRTTRWLATWSASAYVLMAYLVVAGTLEEQFFYYLLVPGLVALVVAADRALARLSRGRARRLLATAVALVGLGLTGASGQAWAATHLTRDDATVQMLAEIRRVVPCGASIAATETTSQFLLPGYDLSEHGTVSELVAGGDQYVLISTGLVSKGLGTAPADTVQWLSERATVVADVPGRTLGHLVLWRLPDPPTSGPPTTGPGCPAPAGTS